MDFTLDQLLENVQYDLTIDNITHFHGNIDYVSSHFADGEKIEFHLSKTQNPPYADFIAEYHEIKKSEPLLSIEAFYNRKAI